jgi:hypothetical protein
MFQFCYRQQFCRGAWSLALVASLTSAVQAAEPPQPPKVSSFAQAADLVKQVDDFLADFETCLASEQNYSDKKILLTRNAHTLAVLGVALGLHDQENRLQESAPALVAAAQELAKAKDYAAAKAAFEKVKAATSGKVKQGPELAWNKKVASLGQIMKEVAATDTRLRRNMRRFDRLAEENARSAALLAVIAQATLYDTHEVKNPDDLGKWYQMSADMREVAASIGTAIRANDKAAAEAGIKRLTQSCDDCHAVFQTE